MDWDDYFINMALAASIKSEDSRTRVGAVIVDDDHCVLSTGYNGLPRGVKATDIFRFKKPQKALFFEHAERNAIYNASRVGTRLQGATMYGLWFPCPDCARAIVQSGITKYVFSNWWLEKSFGSILPLLSCITEVASIAESCVDSTAGDILREGGVDIVVNTYEPILMKGKSDGCEF